MAAQVSLFRVGNGDMTLVTLDSGRTILIDCHIRKAADDDDDDTPDVASQLKDRLKTDDQGRPYIDAMLLSHPDQDHCKGLATHFHLGADDDYPKDSGKILIREMWSSPIVFRRASKNHTLCDDAKAWASEARRRIRRYQELGYSLSNERILILGEDIDGKTDDLGGILIKIDESWSSVNGISDYAFDAILLGPLPPDEDEDEDEETTLSKNDSSVIVRLKLFADGEQDACRLLTGGDAGVAVWERVWERHGKFAANRLEYDLLQTPHHCSWRAISHDSWSDLGENAEVSETALKALSQARDGAVIVASSKPISNDDSDPPCIRAKREYEAIAEDVDGEFVCVGDDGPEPLEYDIYAGGLRPKAIASAVAKVAVVGRQPLPHG